MHQDRLVQPHDAAVRSGDRRHGCRRHMRILSRRVVVSWFVALVVLTLLAAPAAASDHVFSFDYAGSEAGVDVCGVVVDISLAGSVRGTIREWAIGPAEAGENEFWIGTINDRGSETHTNVLTGESLVLSWRITVQEVGLVYVGEGLYEYTKAINGIPVWINGTPLKDRGHIVLTDTVHFGDLSTWEDDYFVGETAIHIAGPHPDYTSDAFCEEYVAAIG